MRSSKLWAIAFALFAVANTGAAVAQQSCTLQRVSSLDMTMTSEGRITVPVVINGHSENLLVDTGAISSMLTERAVSELNLDKKLMPLGLRFTMYGGAKLTQFVTASPVSVGKVAINKMEFVVMPDDHAVSGVDGVIAPDFLRLFDAEFDFAAGKFNLYSQDHCHGEVVYWTHEPFVKMPYEMVLPVIFGSPQPGQYIYIPVVLDGKTFKAQLDTGANVSVMGLEGARSVFGWNDKTADLKSINNTNTHYRYPFKTLAFEGVTVNNPDIVMVSDKETNWGNEGSPNLILGMSVLRQLHLYIAYKENNLYLTAASAH